MSQINTAWLPFPSIDTLACEDQFCSADRLALSWCWTSVWWYLLRAWLASGKWSSWWPKGRSLFPIFKKSKCFCPSYPYSHEGRLWKPALEYPWLGVCGVRGSVDFCASWKHGGGPAPADWQSPHTDQRNIRKFQPLTVNNSCARTCFKNVFVLFSYLTSMARIFLSALIRNSRALLCRSLTVEQFFTKVEDRNISQH